MLKFPKFNETRIIYANKQKGLIRRMKKCGMRIFAREKPEKARIS